MRPAFPILIRFSRFLLIILTLAALIAPDVSSAQSPAKKRRAKPPAEATEEGGEESQSSEEAPAGRGDVNDIINALDYPELQVVPRASDRLKMEAKSEESMWYVAHWPIQLAGAATLFTGLIANGQLRSGLTSTDKTTADTATMVAEAVGAGWIITGVLIGMQKPYKAGLQQISKTPAKDERSALFRERLAEEALEKPARFMRPLKWASVITNFGMSALVGVFLSDQGRVVAGASATLAFLPLMYEDRAIDVYEKHLEYKRKIYRPMSYMDIRLDRENKPTPMAMLQWQY